MAACTALLMVYCKQQGRNPQPLPQEEMVQTGFIAQEVEQAAQQTGYHFSGIDKPKNENDLYGLRYAEFVVPLVKAVQEQQALIEKLSKKVETLEGLTHLLKSKKQQQ